MANEDVEWGSILPVGEFAFRLLETVLAVEGGTLGLRLGNERLDVGEEVLGGSPEGRRSASDRKCGAQSGACVRKCAHVGR